jgi:cytochrome c oxidase cbb3-type subunit I
MTSEANTPARVSDPVGTSQTAVFSGELQHSVATAALGVLACANLVGVWLAVLLVWPDLGRVAGPLTYGRWMPLHLDLQLYGWCSLPSVGLLLARLLPPSPRAVAWARIALAAWVGALAAGAVSWLAGGASGKLFLDWSGPAAWGFAAAQVVLWAVLAAGWIARGRACRDGGWRRGGDLLLVVGLAAVPAVLLFAEQANVYPPVNPDSGGATGHSLLASTLGIVGIALALPALLGRPARRAMRAPALTFVGIYAANWIAWAMIRHGNASHRDLEQVAGLATLGLWPPYLVWWFRLYAWEPAHRRWLGALATWAALLFVDGFAIFLPGVLEGAKFSNSLVAHAHLAMAGMLTSLNMLMLISFAPRTRLADALAAPRPWLAWNTACLAMVAALTTLGWAEGRDPTLVPGGGILVQAIYVVRLLCGLVMAAATLPWLLAAAGFASKRMAARMPSRVSTQARFAPHGS